MSKKFSFNYLYFGFLFFLLLFLHIFSIPKTQGGLLFLGEAFCQIVVSITILIAITYGIEKKIPFFYKAWISFLYFLPLAYLIDFFLLSLMDAPLSHGVNIFLGQGIGKVFIALRAANINNTVLILLGLTIFSFPFLAIWVDRITKNLSQKKPLLISLSQLGKLFGLFFILLLSFDVSIEKRLSLSYQRHLEKRLPWGMTFFSPPPLSVEKISSSFKRAHQKKESPLVVKAIEDRPNIYLFVVESLRKEAVNEKTATNLFSFQKKNISLPMTFSSANFSPMSWFSIFHAQFPIFWRDKEKKGSLPLSLLKQLGYKIHLFSSAELTYFQMDESIFGSHHELADSYCPLPQNEEVCERDAQVLSLLQEALSHKENERGNCFILFLDSSHSEYSWPKNFPPLFFPFPSAIPYIFLVHSHSLLPSIKNRYYNAIHYIDHLFGSFLQTLQEKGLHDSSIIVFTADHGEEFFDEGALFHGTHLNNAQTCIPIFYQFPKSSLSVQTEMTSHVDIFPSILHFLTKDTSLNSLFDGVSLFAPHPWPFILTVHQNGGKIPCLFSLLHRQGRLIGKFKKDIVHSKQWEVIALKNLEDEEIEENSSTFKELSQVFSRPFDRLLQRK